MSIDTVLERLEGVKRAAGGSFIACCPAHDSVSRSSLSITEGDDGRVLLKCFAGCETSDVCAALGLELADLFPPKESGNGKHEIVATYDYLDERGDLLYQVVRFSPKDFRQRKPDGNGGWVWKLGDARRVLYHLPQVLDAVKRGEPVYVCEGEKDVHAVEQAGSCATCNPGGAGKWRAEYATALAGAEIVVVADKDEPGRKHAEQVAESLVGKAKDVLVVEAREGKDAADHLAAGLGLGEFVVVRDDARYQADTPSEAADVLVPIALAELRERVPERVEWVVHGIAARSAITELTASPKRGKTTLLTAAAGAVAEGRPFLGKPTEQTGILYLSEERGQTVVAALHRCGIGSPERFWVLLRHETRRKPWPDVVEDMVLFCRAHDVGLVVVDTLSSWAGLAGDDENSAGAAMTALRPLELLAAENVAVVCTRHQRKSGGEIGESARGSSAFTGGVDIVLSLRGGSDHRRELSGIARFDEVPERLAIEFRDGDYVALGDPQELRRLEQERAIIDALPVARTEALVLDELRERAGGASRGTAQRVLLRLVEEGVVIRERGARDDHPRADAYWLRGDDD